MKPSKRMLGDKAYERLRAARRPARARNQAGHSKSLQQETTVQRCHPAAVICTHLRIVFERRWIRCKKFVAFARAGRHKSRCRFRALALGILAFWHSGGCSHVFASRAALCRVILFGRPSHRADNRDKSGPPLFLPAIHDSQSGHPCFSQLKILCRMFSPVIARVRADAQR